MKKPACSTCLRQCARLHGAGDEVKGAVPSLSPSFLKKIGTDNTETLHVPSSFVKSYSKRLGSSLTFEGPSTDKWTIATEGSFSKCAVNLGLGWSNFVKDHHLQLGDQLLFTLTGDSYFMVEVYDESGCHKLGALDAVNPLKIQVDSNGTTQEANATAPESDAKSLDQEADKSCSKGSTPAGRPSGQKRKGKSEQVKEPPSAKKAPISLSSDESDRETPSAGAGKSEAVKQTLGGEKSRTGTKRRRPKRSQEFYQDADEDDFSLFHKPRARNTPMRSAAAESEKKAKKKPEARKEVPVTPVSRSTFMNEEVGHGMKRYQFVIDGSLEDPAPLIEVK